MTVTTKQTKKRRRRGKRGRRRRKRKGGGGVRKRCPPAPRNNQTNTLIKYTWKVSSLLPKKMSHLCRRVPCEQATCSPGGREQRCCLFVTVLCLRVCHRLRSSRSAWDQNLDYTQLWRSSEQSESSAGRGKYLGQSIRVNIITGSDFLVRSRKSRLLSMRISLSHVIWRLAKRRAVSLFTSSDITLGRKVPEGRWIKVSHIFSSQ